MKFTIKYNSKFVRKGWAMVLWPWMLVGKSKEDFTDRHFRHELEHCYQVKRKTVPGFYLGYAFWWVVKGAFWGGYTNHPYELEAEERENDPLTEQERQWKEQGKVVL